MAVNLSKSKGVDLSKVNSLLSNISKTVEIANKALSIADCAAQTTEPELKSVNLPARAAIGARTVMKRQRGKMGGKDVVRITNKIWNEGTDCDRILIEAQSLRIVNEVYGIFDWLGLIIAILESLEFIFNQLQEGLDFSSDSADLKSFCDGVKSIIGDNIASKALLSPIYALIDVLNSVTFYTRSLISTRDIYTKALEVIRQLQNLVQS